MRMNLSAGKYENTAGVFARGEGRLNRCIWRVKEAHTSASLSRRLMQNGEIFISLAACLGGAAQPTLYIS